MVPAGVEGELNFIFYSFLSDLQQEHPVVNTSVIERTIWHSKYPKTTAHVNQKPVIKEQYSLLLIISPILNYGG